ncbi:Uncharacterised protein [Yersinia kristensenii]|nr:Uncharacterised protein [Yersinia kristensenii]
MGKKKRGGPINGGGMYNLGEASTTAYSPARVSNLPSESLAGDVSITIRVSDREKCPDCPGCPDQYEDYLS